MAANPLQFADGGEYEVDEAQLKLIQDGQGNMLAYIWVASILERTTGQVQLYIVRNRSNRQLIPPITERIPPGAFVHSDELSTYSALDKPNHAYYHLTVNHSAGEYSRTENVPGAGALQVHTNGIEGIWSHLRSRIQYRSHLIFLGASLGYGATGVQPPQAKQQPNQQTEAMIKRLLHSHASSHISSIVHPSPRLFF